MYKALQGFSQAISDNIKAGADYDNPHPLNCRKTYIILKKGVWGIAPSGVRAAAPYSAPSHGEGVWGFGKDAEIERPKALQDAKPTKRS